MPIDIIIFAAVAVYVGVKLFNALGNKDYDEHIQNAKNDNNVVQFPNGADPSHLKGQIDLKFEPITDKYEDLEKKYGPDLAKKIKKIESIDPSFTEDNFLTGAKSAFEVILKAFSVGDKTTLKNLLSKDIYKGFIAEIDKRDKDTKVPENTLVSILASNIKSVALDRKSAKIGVEIISEQINLIKDKDGEIIEGNPSHVNKISELWTFARNLTSSNPNWELIATSNSK